MFRLRTPRLRREHPPIATINVPTPPTRGYYQPISPDDSSTDSNRNTNANRNEEQITFGGTSENRNTFDPIDSAIVGIGQEIQFPPLVIE